MSQWNGSRAGDPRNQRRYKDFTWRMRATLPWICRHCHQPIPDDVASPHPESWTWDHQPSIEAIMRDLPDVLWLAAACDETGGGPSHRRCNEQAASRNGSPAVRRPALARPIAATCDQCGITPHLHPGSHGFVPSLDGVGRSRDW
jgi:hypothetical protein